MSARFLSSLRQPTPFYLIFLIEIWERFGFYGMQAILVYYMIHQMHFSDAQAFNLYGALVALVFGFIAIGGFIGDRVLGAKRTLLLGASLLAVGYFLLGLPHYTAVMYFGMGLIAVGNGLFKANPSSLLSKCYQKGDSNIDGAFTLYYMAVNIGSFCSLLFVPIIAEHFGWQVGFWASTIGLLIAIANFILCYSWVKDIDSPVGLQPMKWLRFVTVLVSALIMAAISSWLLSHLSLVHWLLLGIGITIIVVFLSLIIKHQGQERYNLIVALVLMIEAIVFFVLYMQMPTSLNLYTIHNIAPSLFGIAINPLSFQSLNSVWVLIASPILACFYTRFGLRGKDFSLPTKFTLGMFFCAAGFLIGALSRYFNDHGIISSGWIVAIYFFQSVGELLISGLGLAVVSRLVPPKYTGFMMGAWFMTSSAASVIAGFVASLAHVPDNITNPELTLPIYTHVFFEIGLFTLGFAIIMLLLTPKLNRALLASTHH